MMFTEGLAVAAFLVFVVAAMAVVVSFTRRRTSPEKWDLSKLHDDLQDVSKGLDEVREELTEVRERLPRRIDGRYDLVRKVGQGGVGEVWESVDSKTGDRVALKLLRKKFTVDDHTRRRFSREAEVATLLQHPNVVRTYDAGEDASGQLYLVMELFDGMTVRHILDRTSKGIDKFEIIRIGTAVCEALLAARVLGIVHRDIKPENILAPAGEPYKLTDFGLGFVTSGVAETARMTEEGTISGTPHYMSPEQCRGTLDIGDETDIYSLGCVLYELATGEPPFKGRTLESILLGHCDSARPLVPGEPLLSELLRDMMAIDPAVRPGPRDVIDALDSLGLAGDTL